MKRYHLFLLSLLSAFLLSFSWAPNGFAPLLFIAWIPLLMVENYFYEHRTRYKSIHVFLFSYLTFLVWNLITTWWVYFASAGGAAMAIICNALLMALVFWLFHFTKRKAGLLASNFILILYWIAFEHFHHNWEVTWPWITLGNGFAHYYKWIQWYEYTGVFGGSLWVLILNVLFFQLWRKKKKKLLWIPILLIVFPITISYWMYFNTADQGEEVEVVVVQPNIDPYAKFRRGVSQEQLKTMFQLADEKVKSTTDYLVFPETALTEGGIIENDMSGIESILALKNYMRTYPQLKIVTGASTYRFFAEEENVSATARFNGKYYYDAYNTALYLDSSDHIQVYHKSKLVPGVERMPYPALFKPLENLAIDLGGTFGSLGIQEERSVFSSSNTKHKIAPVICYESVFGNYVGEYILNGADLIFIITNDGWWDDTPGYKQHLAYARLRAIETRRSIARSANTGTSCFINQRGDSEQETNWWETAVITSSIKANTRLTFYTRHGDYIALFCYYLIPLLWISMIIVKFRIEDEERNIIN